MVHLSSVPTDAEINPRILERRKTLDHEPEEDATVSVYGSRFAGDALPSHEMPEREMPKEVAYRMIRDDLSLDGNPMLNLASFVTTYMVSFFLMDGALGLGLGYHFKLHSHSKSPNESQKH